MYHSIAGSYTDRTLSGQIRYEPLTHLRSSLNPTPGLDSCTPAYDRSIGQTAPVLKTNTPAGTHVAGTGKALYNNCNSIRISTLYNTDDQADVDNISCGTPNQAVRTAPGHGASSTSTVPTPENETGVTGGSASYILLQENLLSSYSYITIPDSEVITLYEGVTGPDQVHQSYEGLDIYTVTTTGTSYILETGAESVQQAPQQFIETQGLVIESAINIEFDSETQELLNMGKKLRGLRLKRTRGHRPKRQSRERTRVVIKK